MDRERLERLLEQVKDGKVGVDEALNQLRSLPYEDLGFAKLDEHRGLRKGFPEVIFCQGKSLEQIVKIVEVHSQKNSGIIATKVSPEVFEGIRKRRRDAVYYNEARIVLVGKKRKSKESMESRELKGVILVVSAGTSDIPVAEEAVVTAEILGNKVEKLYDVGVAGVHRLLDHKERLFEAGVIIVVAGMEGALPSLVGGMVENPVIAVPTSIGYGASFEGLAALLGMLNTCAPGVVVVNIDNGFGAGYFASVISR
ncbi:nickel pincer cofactor biosynthesis protein LarB [candidate division TA06 bacterium]|nr:nickel pincer cofactor biosynthesis protein LarB [candidate division TA06 bacterium]